MFSFCTSLTNVTLPNNATTIESQAFRACKSLSSITLPNGLTTTGDNAFMDCTSLAGLTIPASVTNINSGAFQNCTNLKSLLFKGNAPAWGPLNLFSSGVVPLIYYLPGTTGWGPTFSGLPTRLWNPQVQTSAATFGVHSNRFAFAITGTVNLVVVVEACTNLSHPTWFPVGTNTLTGGSSYFSDSQWTNSPRRFYRLRAPT
jgi:hypothetical protein